jgi:hypothetical protein
METVPIRASGVLGKSGGAWEGVLGEAIINERISPIGAAKDLSVVCSLC